MSDTPSFRMTEASKAVIANTYNLMSDHYGDLSFWDRYGQRAVERLSLAPGATVLDAGCGAGAAALPAAEAVGPNGQVIGVDISDGLLELGRRRARERGLGNVTFHNQDMTALTYPDGHFDGVVSAFSIFFVEDITGLIGELWRMVKPGGRLVIVSWAPPIFEPLETLIRLSAAPELPHLQRGPTNMERVMYPHLMAQLMRAAGADGAMAATEYNCHELPHPDDWWTMALGSGLRRIIASMTEEGALRVRERMANWIRDNHARHVATSVVYGVAVKPIS